jgi:hypothetical protein
LRLVSRLSPGGMSGFVYRSNALNDHAVSRRRGVREAAAQAHVRRSGDATIGAEGAIVTRLELQKSVIRTTSRTGGPPDLSDAGPERAAARDGRIFLVVVQSRYYTRQKGQGSYISVLESQRNAVSEPERAPSAG